MAHDIRATVVDDLPELSRFLVAGFNASPGAVFADPEVLCWKYFGDLGFDAGDAPRSYLARHEETGAVVGHVGVCPTRFRGGNLPASGVSTLHMIDWLTSSAGAGVGATLMRRAHQASETQYGFGGSAAGRGVIDRGGYQLVSMVPVFQRVLRPIYWLRAAGHGPVGRIARTFRDGAGLIRRPGHRPSTTVELRPVESFGEEINPILSAYADQAIYTSRDAGLLNHLLRYPRGGVTGFHVMQGTKLRGFISLSLVPLAGGKVREGRLVECILDAPDEGGLWHAAIAAATHVLKNQGADRVIAFAPTPWMVGGLGAAGYSPAHPLEFRLRDRAKLIPHDLPFHLTAFEADYAYT